MDLTKEKSRILMGGGGVVKMQIGRAEPSMVLLHGLGEGVSTILPNPNKPDEKAVRLYGRVIAGKGSGGNQSSGKFVTIELDAEAFASIVKFVHAEG